MDYPHHLDYTFKVVFKERTELSPKEWIDNGSKSSFFGRLTEERIL